MSLKEELEDVVKIAHAAAELVLENYGKVRRLTKRQDEAVTEADRASQRYIVAELKKRFPTDGIIGEENETGDAITFDVSKPNGRVWVIDPIDGTNNFICGLGAFAVCIGLLDAGVPVMGAVHDVTRDWTYMAAKGHGAWLGSRKISALPGGLCDSSMLMVTSNLLDEEGKAPNFAMRWLAQTNWKIRMLGSAAIESVQVAAGIAHGAITINGKLWDVVAPAAVVIEAGGVICDPTGKEIFPFDLVGYTGGKVPYLSAAPGAKEELLREIGT
jgi:myo-inositol-1(or 4)-monophosphatase